MIEIHPLRDKCSLADYYISAKVDMNDNSMAVVATDGDEVIGNCLFDMNDDNIMIHHLEPTNDRFFADGLLRSALHVGVENGKMLAFYSENSLYTLFNSLGFIKNAEKNELNVEKLFSSCQNCEKE